MNIRQSFTGNTAMAEALARLPDALAKGIVVGALKAGAEPMRQAAADQAPRSQNQHEHLADRIVASLTRDAGDGERLAESQYAIAIGPAKNVFWGLFQEFGTIKMAAHPFLRPAFDATEELCLSIIGEQIWIGLRAAPGGAGASGPSSGGGLL